MKRNLPLIKKNEERYFLAVDIGTETVKAIIFKRKNEEMTVIGSSFQSLERLELKDNINFWVNLTKKAILKSIEEVKEKIPKKKKITVLLKLPANILKANLFFHSFIRSNPKIEIQAKEEKKIYQEILNGAQREISNIFFRSYGILPKDLEFINLEILGIKIDGYEVSHLQGFKGQNLNFKIMAIFSLKYYLELFKKIFENINLENLKIVHPVQNLKAAFSNNISDGIFLDVGGDLTQIFIIKEGELSYISDFAIGGRTFAQSLSQDLGISEKMAEKLKEKYSQKILSEETRQKIKKILDNTLKDWFLKLKSKLKEAKQFPLPSNFYFFGGGSNLPDIKEIIEEGDWEEFVFLQNPKVNLISLKDFKNIEDKTNTLNNPQAISSVLICYAPLEIK